MKRSIKVSLAGGTAVLLTRRELAQIPLSAGTATVTIRAASSNGHLVVDDLGLVNTSAGTPPPSGQRYEAETAPAQCQGTIDSNQVGYSGSGFCNGDNAAGAYAQFTATSAAAGTPTLGIRFANGSSSGARSANLVVNGTTVGTVSFESTGAWTTWSTTTATIPLNAGSSTIRLDPTTTAGLPNIDYLDVAATTG